MEQGRTLAVVPALAFDEEGFRIGYGGGFYDTFLARFAGKTAGSAENRISSRACRRKAPSRKHDRAVDFVVTEKRVLFLQARAASKRPGCSKAPDPHARTPK